LVQVSCVIKILLTYHKPKPSNTDKHSQIDILLEKTLINEDFLFNCGHIPYKVFYSSPNRASFLGNKKTRFYADDRNKV